MGIVQPPLSDYAISSAGGLLKANLLAAADGSIRVASEDAGPTYTCCTSLFTPASAPTDVAILLPQNSYGNAIFLKKVTVNGLSTSGGLLTVRLQESANGGVGGYVSPPVATNDIFDVAPTATVWQLTANRSSGGNGISSSRPLLGEVDFTLGVSGTSSGTSAVFDFTSGNKKCPTLSQNLNYITVNFNGQTMPSGTQLRVTFEWQEQRKFRVGAIGDSTTSNATSGYLNHGITSGGIGSSGLINSLATIYNFGANGEPLYAYLNNTGSTPYPAYFVQGYGLDIAIFCYGINDIRTGQIGADQTSATNRLVAMIDSAIYSFINGTTASAVYTSPLATSYTIASITWAANVATVTTAAPHGFGSTETCAVTIAGTSLSGYNTTAAIVVTGASTLTYSLASNPGGTATGGTATFATIWPNNATALPDVKIILWGPNSFTTDDAGDGPHYYLSASGNTTLSGLWSGLTLAQAAQEASTILYNAYAAFANDSRIFALIQKQDTTFGKTCVTTAASRLMSNQIHPGSRGQVLETRAMLPTLIVAMNAVAPNIY